MTAGIDYSKSGLDIQSSMVDHAKRFPSKAKRPQHIIWNGLEIKTFDWWDVPSRGIVRLEFISLNSDIEQAVDLQAEEGAIELPDGTKVPILRTWADSKFTDIVQYNFYTKTKRLCVWNVYKMRHAGGQVVDERWTGNAGFWIETLNTDERIYHCSHGMAGTPDFDLLTFKVSVSNSGKFSDCILQDL